LSSTTSPTVEDLKTTIGLSGVAEDNRNTLLKKIQEYASSHNGKIPLKAEMQSMLDDILKSLQESKDRIINYANDSSKPAPTIDDYKTIGVTPDVNSSLLDTVNSFVDNVSGTDVDTVSKIQNLVTAVNNLVSDANLTGNNLTALGLQNNIDTSNTNAVNLLNSIVPDGNNSATHLKELVQIAQKLQEIANGTAQPNNGLSEEDLQKIGLQVPGKNTLEGFLKAVQDSNPSDVNDISKLRNLANTDKTAPKWTSGANASTYENNTSINYTMQVEDNDTNITYSIVNNILDYDDFSLSGDHNQTLSFNTAKDFENPSDENNDNNYTVTIRATDTAGNTADKNINVVVINTMDTVPSLANPGNKSIKENATTGTTVVTVETNGTNSEANTTDDFTINSMDFNISSSGVIQVAKVLDFETTPNYTLTITATNSAGTSNTISFDINITDVVDNKPVIKSPQTTSIDENISNGTFVVQVPKNGSTVDENTTDHFYITKGNDGNFTIDDNGKITTVGRNLDFETTKKYILTIVAENAEGNSSEINATINIGDINVSILYDQSTPAKDANINTSNQHITIKFSTKVVEVASKYVKVYVDSNHTTPLRNSSTDSSPDMNTSGITSTETLTITTGGDSANHYKYGSKHFITIDAGAYMVDDGRTSNDVTKDTGGSGVWEFTVNSGIGPCGCDELDNCDLPAGLQ
jgi:hypothetical protein